MTWIWKELKTLSGDAVSIPPLLDDLLHGTYEKRARAFQALEGKAVNQGDLFSSAAAVTDIIITELEEEGVLSEHAWLMLHELFRGASYGRTFRLGADEYDIEVYCRDRVLNSMNLIDRAVVGLSGDAFTYASFLLSGIGEYSREVIPILEREIANSQGARLASARDALEVALELSNKKLSDC
ncbi:hypothetical protein [Spongiactinospora rosea]|uniref:hypothetical protein n=1 Tax=Spongiactinospora rosea TaxID=2248750 RepID=UPI001CED86FF|nr:hypothetical protein [Spongiactinospora rosea]